MQRRCGNCRYRVGGTVPHCRFGPPIALDEFTSSWPYVPENEWCFQHTWSWRWIVGKAWGYLKKTEGVSID